MYLETYLKIATVLKRLMGKKYRAVNKRMVIRAKWAIIWKFCNMSSLSLEPSEKIDSVMIPKNSFIKPSEWTIGKQ